jgi:hypothetical protein
MPQTSRRAQPCRAAARAHSDSAFGRCRVALLLLATNDDFFPFVVFVFLRSLFLRGELLRRLAGDLLLGRCLVLVLVVVLVVVFDFRGPFEVFDASAERIADTRELVGSEYDHDDQQDDDELAHSGHGGVSFVKTLASFRVAA